MKMRWLLLVLLLMASFGSHLQAQVMTEPKNDPSPSEASTRSAKRLSGVVRVSLQQRLEMKKLESGSPVEAKLAQNIKLGGEALLPKNSRFLGHVVEAGSRDRGDAVTRLAVVFDRAVAKDGREVPLYGFIAGVLAPTSDSGDSISSLQETRLRRMQVEAATGTATPETRQTIGDLYRTAVTGQPTSASKQFNCQEVQGFLWCGPAGHTPLGSPSEVEGMPGVLLQGENTPQGPLGVLVSGKSRIDLNRGLELLIQLVPRP